MIVEMSREFLEDRHGVRWGDKGAVETASSNTGKSIWRPALQP